MTKNDIAKFKDIVDILKDLGEKEEIYGTIAPVKGEKFDEAINKLKWPQVTKNKN
jgi:hypothetical protein